MKNNLEEIQYTAQRTLKSVISEFRTENKNVRTSKKLPSYFEFFPELDFQINLPSIENSMNHRVITKDEYMEIVDVANKIRSRISDEIHNFINEPDEFLKAVQENADAELVQERKSLDSEA